MSDKRKANERINVNIKKIKTTTTAVERKTIHRHTNRLVTFESRERVIMRTTMMVTVRNIELHSTTTPVDCAVCWVARERTK